MLGEAQCRRIAEQALAASQADETEVVLLGTYSGLTRFANSAIHQHVFESNVELRVRAALGKRVGVAATNDLSPAGIGEVVARAMTIAEHQAEDPDFPGLPEPAPIAEVASFHAPTAEFGPAARARAVGLICALADERGIVASGAFSTGAFERAVANSRGLWAYEPASAASIKIVLIADEDASGYAERASRNVEELDFEALAREAIDKAERSRGAVTLEPGVYPVVLEPYAVAEALEYLGYMGFGARALQEGHSFLCGRLGQQIVSARVSIWDDARDPRGLPAAFDFEGVPTQRVTLIERGVARGVVYDTRTARRDGARSTGHALPAPNPFGPYPSHLLMAPGDAEPGALAAALEHGIWVTRFHYVNTVHPRQAILTGMTRDGTFLVERGEVTRPVRNLRFTQNMLEALSGVRTVGRELVAVGGFGGATLAPALVLDGFNFTGVSTLGA